MKLLSMSFGFVHHKKTKLGPQRIAVKGSKVNFSFGKICQKSNFSLCSTSDWSESIKVVVCAEILPRDFCQTPGNNYL